MNGLEKRSTFVIEVGRMIFKQETAVTIDPAKRSFEIVRNGISEGFQFSTLGVERGSARSDALFELVVEKIERFLSALPALSFNEQHGYEDSLQKDERRYG